MLRQRPIGPATAWRMVSVWGSPSSLPSLPTPAKFEATSALGLRPGDCRAQRLEGHSLTWARWERGGGGALGKTPLPQRERRTSTQTGRGSS